MKRILVLVVGLALSVPALGQAPVEELTWLAGEWRMEDESTSTMIWSDPGEKTVLGMLQIRDSTLQQELIAAMVIEAVDQDLQLTWRRVDPHTLRGPEHLARPARRGNYTLIDQDAGRLVFESDTTDCYRRISFERVDETTLTVALMSDETAGAAVGDPPSESLLTGTPYDFKRRAPEHPNILVAKQLRGLLKSQEYEAARELVNDDPRRWFESTEGEGRAWEIGPGKKGPWSAWDEHFRAQTRILYWEAHDDSATVVLREVNDYFLLLERGSVATRITYLFDEDGRIRGRLIRTFGKRPPGLTESFLAWARANETEEIEELMPDGSIDPTGDHPSRFRALLNRWRVAEGLDPIR